MKIERFPSKRKQSKAIIKPTLCVIHKDENSALYYCREHGLCFEKGELDGELVSVYCPRINTNNKNKETKRKLVLTELIYRLEQSLF